LKGRTFSSLEEQNEFLWNSELTVADTWIHGTTHKEVDPYFEEVERKALQKLPIEGFPSFQEARRAIHRDADIEVACSYYIVPPEYLGHLVWVIWDTRLVRFFDDLMEPLQVLVRQEPGAVHSTHHSYIAAEKISGVERRAAWQLARVRRIGPNSLQWAESVALRQSAFLLA